MALKIEERSNRSMMVCKRAVAFDLALPMPAEGVQLAGFIPTRAWDGSGGGLCMSLVVFDATSGPRTAIVGLDVLFIDDQFESDLRALLSTNVNLLLVATHTHSAPNLARSVQSLGLVDPDWYEQVLGILAAAINAHTSGVSLKYARKSVHDTDFCINRRLASISLDYGALKRGQLSIGRRTSMAPNPEGASDGRLHVVEFADGAGKVRACIWSLAAHPTSEPKRNSMSADYPGVVRAHLKSLYGSDCVAIYLPGFCGSSKLNRPRKAWKDMSTREKAFMLLPLHHAFPPVDPNSYVALAKDLAEKISSPQSSVDWVPLEESEIHFNAAKSEVLFHDQKKGDLVLTARGLSIEGVCKLAFINGEPLSEWYPLVYKHLGADQSMLVSGYGAGDCLYIPPESELPKGGYEVERFRWAFGLDGTFAADIDQKVLGALVQVTNS